MKQVIRSESLPHSQDKLCIMNSKMSEFQFQNFISNVKTSFDSLDLILFCTCFYTEYIIFQSFYFSLLFQ